MVLSAVLFAGLALSLFATDLPTASPSDVGMSAERLERLDAALREFCETRRIPGAVVLILRDGQAVFHRAFGKLDLEAGTPMPRDAVFRIASQTKAVTSVAVMTLIEDGRLLLTDPVSIYIPGFNDTKVAVPIDGNPGAGYTEKPVKRPITIRDLLTHTAGISYGTGPAAKAYAEAGVQGWFFADKDETIGDSIERLARLPIDAHPGERYIYGFSTDILGRVVEVVSGMSLADYFRTRITEPLGMTDTHFFLPEENIGRLTPVYGLGKDGRTIERVEDPAASPYVKGPRKCFSGGAGLLSTARDYALFLQMLLDGGRSGLTRILGPKTVELMTSNHVGDLYAGGRQGFGLGFWVTEHVGRSGEVGSVGAFGWGGAYATTYWVDPAERLVAVFMTQMLPAGNADFQPKFRNLVYQAIALSYAGPFANK